MTTTPPHHKLPPDIPALGPEDELISELVGHPDAVNDTSQGRRLALQALYEIDSSGHSMGDVLNAQMASYDHPMPRKSLKTMRRLVMGVIDQRPLLDDILQRFAPEFPLEQVAVVDRNILRIAVFEFALARRTPVGVAIDEAIELSKIFGSDNSPRFINGVLGSLADDAEALMALAEGVMPPAPIEAEDEDEDEDADALGLAADDSETGAVRGPAFDDGDTPTAPEPNLDPTEDTPL